MQINSTMCCLVLITIEHHTVLFDTIQHKRYERNERIQEPLQSQNGWQRPCHCRLYWRSIISEIRR